MNGKIHNFIIINNSLEISFADDMDEFYDAPREFHILGSCLFHRGLLVSSHLSKTDTTDILLWLKVNRNILAVSAKHPIRRIVAWKEIFPSKRYNDKFLGSNDSDTNDRYEINPIL